MPAGFPVKQNYAAGDILTATQMNDLSSTLNYLDPTAKGDLFPASSGTALTRLAVGNNGETLVADSSTSTGLRYQGSMAAGRNGVINGGFDIWQRGTSIAGAASASNYTADRWGGYRSGYTYSRQTTSDGTNLPFIQYCMRAQRNSGTTDTNGVNLFTSFESINSIPFAGKTVVFSFYARAGANYSPTSNALTARFTTGTGTDQNILNGFTGGTDTNLAVTLTTTWQRFTTSIVVGGTTTQIGLQFFNTPVGTAGANDWFEVTGVQVEIGSVATQFTRTGGTIQGELAACQRYYQRVTAGGVYGTVTFLGNANSTTLARIVFATKQTFRVKPTAVDYANVVLNDGANVPAAGTITIGGDNENAITLTCTTTGLTQFRPYVLSGDNNAAGYVGLSAEL